MLARVFALLPFAALAVAGNVYQCNTGAVNCCNTVGTSSTPEIASLLESFSSGDLIGGVDIPVDALLGARCTTLAAGGSCSQRPICCEDNNQIGGVLNVNCSPVTVLG